MSALLASCPDTETALSPEEAFLVLEPYWVAMRDRFTESGYSRCREARLYVAPWMHDTHRHFAATTEDGQCMILAPEMAELPEDTVLAICAHEFGHAVDFLYPGEFVLGHDRDAVRRGREGMTDGQWTRWRKDWEGRDQDVIEFTADGIAQLVTGHRIGYTGPCLVQAFDRGRARPQGLR